MNKKIKLVFMIVLISLLLVLLSISFLFVLNKYSVSQNNKLKRDSSILFADVYGIKLSEANNLLTGHDSVDDDDKEKLMRVNLHRNSEEDLEKILGNYINSENILDHNYTAYDLRIDIVKEDPYAENFEVPELLGVYTFENLKLMKKIRQKDYSIFYVDSNFTTAEISIGSNGKFTVEHFELNEEERYEGDSGWLDDKAMEDVLIKAVKLGFFQLPKEISLITYPSTGYLMYKIRIGDKIYEVGGWDRAYLDDVYYKIHGSLLNIIHEETEMYYEFPVY